MIKEQRRCKRPLLFIGEGLNIRFPLLNTVSWNLQSGSQFSLTHASFNSYFSEYVAECFNLGGESSFAQDLQGQALLSALQEGA